MEHLQESLVGLKQLEAEQAGTDLIEAQSREIRQLREHLQKRRLIQEWRCELEATAAAEVDC